jgi:hypothetical protein
VSKLLALPVFCLVVMLTRLLSSALLRLNRPALKDHSRLPIIEVKGEAAE